MEMPAYYSDVYEISDTLADRDNTATIEEIAFLKARIARGHASPQEVARLIECIMTLND